MITDHFYNRLPVNHLPLSELLGEAHLFYPVPADWYVIVTDITNSTKAVLSGQHETVNLVATGSIVTVLNLAYKSNITIPFFFGGDGATFLVPPSLIESTMQALIQYKDNTKLNFNLDIRAGAVTVSRLQKQGHQLLVTKFRSTETFVIPIVLGTGLSQAEKLIKGEDYLFDGEASSEELDLEGMQCRWDRILPPEDCEEVVTLLVLARGDQPVTFRKVMEAIEHTYGAPHKRQPISVAQLKLKPTLAKLSREIKVRLGKMHPFSLLHTWFTSLLGSLYFRTGKGKEYLHSLVNMSDTLVIDGRINTVISGKTHQRRALTVMLDQLEHDGEIWYGIHTSGASVMSCYVRDLKDGHIHFVDGAEGGYTKAASILKQKLKHQPSTNL